MHQPLRYILAASCMLYAHVAFGLDANASIKVTPILKTSTSWNGTPIAYPAGTAEITGQIVEIMPHGETGWHQHSVPSFGLILEGTLEVTLADGSTKLMKPGDSVAEVVNTPHQGKNIGDTPVKLVVFYAGAVGTPTTSKQAVKVGEPVKPMAASPSK